MVWSVSTSSSRLEETERHHPQLLYLPLPSQRASQSCFSVNRVNQIAGLLKEHNNDYMSGSVGNTFIFQLTTVLFYIISALNILYCCLSV